MRRSLVFALLSALCCSALPACSESDPADADAHDAAQAEQDGGAPEPWTGYAEPEICNTDSGMDGDDVALCAPDAHAGIQLHFGPSNYDDPAELKKFTLAPGEEATACVFVRVPDEADKYFGQYVGRSRPGAHHLQISWAAPADASRESGSLGPCGSVLSTQFVAIAQTANMNVPDLSIPRPRNATNAGGLDFEGGASPMRRGAMLEMTTHFLNTTGRPILREAWINLYYKDPATVKHVIHPISMISAGIRVPAHGKQTFRRSCSSPLARTVSFLQGHSHVGSQRFSMWRHVAKTNELVPIYTSFDPLDPAFLTYNATVKNPEADLEAAIPGGPSGSVSLEAGDSLVWECELQNDTDKPIGDGGPGDNMQMCYTFGGHAVEMGKAGATWQCFAATATQL
jgi:hypothetical protein